MSKDEDFEKMVKNIQSKINQDEERDYSRQLSQNTGIQVILAS